MNFSKIIGKIDKALVTKAEEKLSQIFLELGVRYDNEHVGSGIGGDPLIFSLIYPVEHVCTLNIPTAATDGKRYYWNPKFVLKQSKIGLRIICAHEAWHSIYMHPQRRGSRLPKLWNIAVDYIVNGNCMDDFKARKQDPVKMFSENLGRFMTLENYANILRDPFKKTSIPGFEDLDPIRDSKESDVELPAADEDRELTPEEIQELERREKKVSFYFADPNLAEEMKRPEKIYDYLYSLLPRCSKCGRIGFYKLPKKDDKKKGKNKKKDKDQDQNEQGNQSQEAGGNQQGDNDQHDHGDGNPCNCPNHGNQNGQGNSCDHEGNCDECGEGIDIFGLGGTVDDHMDTTESEEKLSKRISDAMEAAKKMAGHVPASLEDELGKLTAPKITWEDFIRGRLLKARAGGGRNDWTRFKTRPMFTGLLVPKRRSYYASFGCLLDTSGSMSKDDMAFGVSQLASLDEKSEGTIVPADATIYWNEATKIRKANPEELTKVKVVGRGGTRFSEFFSDYKDNIGECDFLVVITDGYLDDTDIANMANPGVDVYWLVTAESSFTPPFGKKFSLRSL